MKTHSFLRSIGMLLLASSAFAQDDKKDVLIDQDFNKPTGLTLSYPPPEGTDYKRFDPNISAWANKGGQIAVSYAEGAGTNQSGGLHCTIAKPSEERGYLGVNCPLPVYPVVSVELVETYLKSLTVDFAAKLPEGKRISLHVTAKVPDGQKVDGWSNRLVLAEINGTGEFQKHSFKFSEAMARKGGERLNGFLAECIANGMSEVFLDVVWHANGGEWFQDEWFDLDDVKITQDRRP